MASESCCYVWRSRTAIEAAAASGRRLAPVDGQTRALLSATCALDQMTFALDGARDDLLAVLRAPPWRAPVCACPSAIHRQRLVRWRKSSMPALPPATCSPMR